MRRRWARFALPPAFRKPEFTTNRRRHLGSVLARIASQVGAERAIALRADATYIFERNMSGLATLGKKRILLVGCGTIGGFLAHQMAQSGAGFDGGTLTLIDPDVMKPGNLGRHLLGAPFLNRNKAEATHDFLLQQLPMLEIKAIDGDVLKNSPAFEQFDLVVDATGEEALSIALNERLVRARPKAPAVLYAWLLGNGAAAQCLLNDGAGWACYKCLQTELAGQPRFRTLRGDVEIIHERNIACGDSSYIPFPVSRSVAAAALACECVLGWARGVQAPRFRSRTFDKKRAYDVKDADPSPIAACPACGAHR